jgi:hypothetical protein
MAAIIAGIGRLVVNGKATMLGSGVKILKIHQTRRNVYAISSYHTL